LVYSKDAKKETFGGLGEPSACSLTTENVLFRQQEGRFEIQNNRRKGLIEKKESSCFRTSHVSKHRNDGRFNRRLAAWENMMIIRGFKTKGFRFRRTFSSMSFPNLCKSMTLSHDRTESLPSQQKIGSSWTGYVFSLETRIVIQSPKIAESIFKNGRFATKS
jgi:hypothetical protein